MNIATTPLEASSDNAGSLDDTLKVLCRVCKLTGSQFTAFRQFYNEVGPEAQPQNHPNMTAIVMDRIGLPTHKSVVESVNKLRSSPEKTAKNFWTEAFPHCTDQDQESAARQTVKLAYLIDPASQDDYPNGFRFENEPVYPVKWQPEQRFKDFFNTAFPTDTQDLWTASSKRKSLKAWKLCQRLKLKIVRTDDLAQHLVYNPKTKSLAVFHQIEWLKAQIMHTKNRKLDETTDVSLTAGTLPPQLLVETLYTIYAILFPVGTDKKSTKFAKRLVRADRPEDARSAFDNSLLIYDGSVHQIPTNFKYLYWSRRLKALQALVEVRPPKNNIISWFERHTSERNALTVAIIGLFLSVLFGFLGLLVGIFQVVVSTWAWKYPLKGPKG